MKNQECSYCGEEFPDHKAYLDHVPCEGMAQEQARERAKLSPSDRRTRRIAKVADVQIMNARTLYGGPHEDQSSPCEHCGKRKSMSPCPHCGRP